MLVYICTELVHSICKMSSHGVFTIIICKHTGYLCKICVVLICGKYNTLTLQFKINIAIRVPLHRLVNPLNLQIYCGFHQSKLHQIYQVWTFKLLYPANVLTHLHCTPDIGLSRQYEAS